MPKRTKVAPPMAVTEKERTKKVFEKRHGKKLYCRKNAHDTISRGKRILRSETADSICEVARLMVGNSSQVKSLSSNVAA